jgi:hypothetical protein
VQDYGRTANRILAAALVLSLAATIYLITQNDDRFGIALLITVTCAVGLAALPSIAFHLYARRAAPLMLVKAMRSAVLFSAAVLLFASGAVAYLMGWGVWIAPAVLVAAFAVWTIVRASRTPTAEGGPRLAYGGSTVVGVVFVFLAIVSIPKFACGCGGTKDKAYHVQMKSDLRNLLMAQEMYFADHLRFGTAEELAASRAYYASTGVILTSVVVTDSTAWHAVVRHTQLTDECGIFVGRAPAGAMHDAHEGEPQCWPAPAASR